MIPRALIVDDEPSILRMLARAMTLFGWETDAFPSAERAMAEFIPGKYDLALCDVDLRHGSDGFALAQELKARDSGLRVVMMSVNPLNAARARAMGLQLLAKPFRLEDIPFS